MKHQETVNSNTMPQKSKDYTKSKIYIIRNTENDKVYIGSTTQPLSKRMAEHRWKIRNKKCGNYPLYVAFKDMGVDKFYIELLEEYPCSNVEQLLAREGHFIRKHNSYENGYNQVVAGRTVQEYRHENREVMNEKLREYRRNNLDHERERGREYYHEHKEERNRKTKEWRQRNKEKYNEYQRQRYAKKRQTSASD